MFMSRRNRLVSSEKTRWNLANGNVGLMLTEHAMVMYDLSLKLWVGDATPGLWLQPWRVFGIPSIFAFLFSNVGFRAPHLVSVVLIEAQYWVGMMERFSFAYAFSLAEAVMTVHGFHKDETICILAGRPIMIAAMTDVSSLICDIDVWIADMYLGWATQMGKFLDLQPWRMYPLSSIVYLSEPYCNVLVVRNDQKIGKLKIVGQCIRIVRMGKGE
ncbi:hypothetical protein Tco_1182206 [Tanacetum coccineum]